MNQRTTNFDEKAATWDEDPRRVTLANDVADTIIREITPTHEMDVLDYGCGSGLVTLRIQPLVKSITGADNSKGMLDVIQKKIDTLKLKNVRTQFIHFEQGEKIEGTFHLILSSMTLHHIPEPAPLLQQFYDLLLPEGCLCIADLDTEDGTFHSDNTGVVQFGFERTSIQSLFEKSGFRDVHGSTAATVVKNDRNYSVFLISGKK